MIVDGKFYTGKIVESEYDDYLKKCIEDTCSYCIENTFGKTEEKINKPIMMLGKIQSGKTRAFTGVIALAFDNNFDMVFILTKNSKALIQQTVTRMKQEFKKHIDEHEVFVTDIMKANARISGYQLEKKNIIISKKEKNNITKVLEFIKNYSISSEKRCLIIDDEADTTGIGYSKIKDSEDFTLRKVSSMVNEMRGSLDGCVFAEVTATPYALYLQPEFDEDSEPKPIKPIKTILVPSGDDYIGGDYYFVKSKDEDSPASYLFEPMSQEEHDLVSTQKRKGKKSKIDDRRCFKEEEILVREDRLPIFKKGLINFIVGGIVLREINNSNTHYAYVIHTATQKGSHVSLQNIAENFLQVIKDRTIDTEDIIENLLQKSYEDIKKSIIAYNYVMPKYDIVKDKFYMSIDRGYYSIDVVNSEQEVDVLLNEETGELNLTNPFSIFVGGQVLDRGVTIPNMIGFYYGRNPKTMQQDTVLQHSRMFGYRKNLLAVTRFYTTERIHSNLEKITEIDLALREDIEMGKQGNGIYFIASRDQDKVYGKGGFKPCSPDKIRVSDIVLLKSHKRILPVGFTTIKKSDYTNIDKKIRSMLNNNNSNYFSIDIEVDKVEELVREVYKTIVVDEDSLRFVPIEEFITALRFMSRNCKDISVIVKTNKNNKKHRDSGRIEDAPETGEMELNEAKKKAIDKPAVILLQEEGNDEEWGFRPFWWPILIAPKNVPKTIFASKIVGENIRL